MEENIDVAIIGGGLAGLSAGVYLAGTDKNVVLLESMEQLGGRTSCWTDNGMQVESGFHRYLGFYDEMPKMLEKAGISLDEMLVWTDEIEIRLPNNTPPTSFGMSIFHEPILTLEGIFGNNDFLSVVQKASLGKFFAKGFLELKNNPKKLDTYSVLEYAQQSDVSMDTIEKVLIPLTEGLFFLKIENYSAYHLFALFAPYLAKLHKSRVGAFKNCMSSAMIDPIENYLLKNNLKIYKNTSVNELVFLNKHKWELVLEDNNVQASQVILATPVTVTQKLLANYANKHDAISELMKLESMPAVCIQCELNEPALDTDSVVFSPNTILASYTEQSRTTFPNSKGRFSAILSNPEELLEKDDLDIFKKVIIDSKKLGINMPESNVIEYRINRWKNDFYSYARNMYDKRPSTEIGFPSLFLAGDYTNQKYLQTMEGAVYSGRLAAQKVLN